MSVRSVTTDTEAPEIDPLLVLRHAGFDWAADEIEQLRSVVHRLSTLSYSYMGTAARLVRFLHAPDDDGTYHHAQVVARHLYGEANQWVEESRATRRSAQYDRLVDEKYELRWRLAEVAQNNRPGTGDE